MELQHAGSRGTTKGSTPQTRQQKQQPLDDRIVFFFFLPPWLASTEIHDGANP
jgi:hypothetical protein